jgi:phosphoenolpyruvate---glycerone phosphotransferase subunit DhaL
MEYILNSNSAFIVENLIKTIQENKDYLSEIDGAIGDGDHGINMNKGFTMCKERIQGKEIGLSEALKVLGRVLLMEIGGSMGPLYGTFFIEMSKEINDKENIDKVVFRNMIKRAVNAIEMLGKAKVGDKTLMDTLIPAVDAYERALAEDKSFSLSLQDMKIHAEAGKESTINLVAKIGRASRLGERSRGVLDAGATSCNLILQSIADSIIMELEK